MIFIIYLYKIFGKKQDFSSIMNHNVTLIIKKVIQARQYISFINHIFVIFVFNILLLNYSFIIRYSSQLLCFGSIGIQISRFLESLIGLSYLWNIFLLFLKKELKPSKKLNEITKQKTFTNNIITTSSIIIELFCLINIAYYEKLHKRQQHFSLLIQETKFLINPKNYPIVPLFILWLDDNEIIWDAGVGCESESIDQGRSYVDKSINISDCFFKRYSSYSGNGGVIYVTVSSYSVNINYSMFYNCVCSHNAGAVYISSSNSCLRMICANKCSCGATYVCHFALLVVTQINQVEYLSISNCSHTTSGNNPIRLESGNQSVDNTNISMNHASTVSGIWIYSPSSFISSHCTFSNNKVSNYVCIYLHSTSGTISMSYANIVHNNSPSIGVVYAWGVGSRKMMYCIFQNNQNTLFNLESGSLEVSHSFIDHSASFSTSTAVLTSNNNSFTNRITYQLQFFKSYYCNAQLPVPVPSPMRTFFEMQTPVISPEKSPIRSIEETLSMTYKRTIKETPKETIPRTFAELICTNQMANWREISVTFSIAFLFPVIIIMIS